MAWWQILIPVLIGWALGILSLYLTEVIARRWERKRVERILVAEMQLNQSHLETLKESGDSGPENESEQDNTVSAPFQKSGFLSLGDKLGLLDFDIVARIRRYYELLQFIEHSQELIQKNPDMPHDFRERMRKSCIDAAGEAAEIGSDLIDVLRRK